MDGTTPPIPSRLRWAGKPVKRRSILLGMGAIGGFLVADLGVLNYAGQWLGTGTELTRQAFIDRFRAVFGNHPGFRKNHAKGVAVTGYFDSSGEAASISRAKVFAPGRTVVAGRFSFAGGNPNAPDAPGATRGLGLAIGASGRDQWRTAMVNLPVFPVNSPQGFYDQLLAQKVDKATGQPDPKAMAAFLKAHPETAAAMKIIKAHPPTPGFADSAFSGLNTFYFINSSGKRTPIRWQFIPQQAALPPASSGDNTLFDPLVRQIRSGPLKWNLHLLVGTAQDTIDPTVPWPADRPVVNAGVLVLTGAETEAPGNARDINFDPLVLPDGIEPSADPLLSTRSAVYAASYRLRSGEPKSTSPVQVDGGTA